MKVYFVRHGTTEWNLQGRMQGHADICLAPQGIEDAQKTALLLKNIVFDYIMCTPLKRGIQTAEIINQFHNVPITIEPNLIERDFGILDGVKKDSFDFSTLFDISINKKYDKAESLDAFYNRIFVFLDRMKGMKGTILMVAHGGVSIPIQYYLYGKDYFKESYDRYILKNGQILEFEI